MSGEAARMTALLAGLALAPAAAGAEPLRSQAATTFGTPGIVEMPSAEMAPDADLWTTVGRIGETTRTTLTFQVAQRLSGSFRYARLRGYELDGSDRYDRSFDLRLALLDEGAWWPAFAIGLQDFIGTGIYSGEYVVATRSAGPEGRLRLSAGLGWGRLATRGVIAGEAGTRVDDFVETGGTANLERLFTGPVAAFAGATWDVTDRLRLAAEYATDAYATEEERGLTEPGRPWNVGASYAVAPGTRLSAGLLRGNELGLQLTLSLNPRQPPFASGLEAAPVPVVPRPPRAADAPGWSGTWAARPARRAAVQGRLAEILAAEGLVLEAAALRPAAAEIRVRNTRWGAVAQAVGRTARVMSRVLPPSVETFRIVPVQNGVPLAAVTLARRDVERLSHAPAEAMLARLEMDGGAGRPDDLAAVLARPRLAWGIGPYLEPSLFDPDDPLRADLGLSFAAELELAPGLVASGLLRQPVLGNLDEIERESDSTLPRVRSDFRLYVDDRAPRLDRLTLAHYGRPSDRLYSRVTAGALERMFAGVSGELLWAPVDSRLALGAELAWVRQRDPDDLLGVTDYDVATGHLSAYYAAGNGYYGQVDVGRYLAGDTGATFTLERLFDNGWRVGAYATFTDVSFEEFGEGSFDKGLRVTVPVQWLTGQPSRARNTTVLRPLTRDGGARLEVEGRLYERVRDSRRFAIDARGGRFWR